MAKPASNKKADLAESKRRNKLSVTFGPHRLTVPKLGHFGK
jgi:hypothetical protein